jgi:S1-C subfamily serine protease
MVSRRIVAFISILLVLSLTACSGLLQVDIPTATPEEVEIKVPAGTPVEVDTAPEVRSVPAGLDSLQSAYEQVYEDVLPSVVSISVIRTITGNAAILPGFPFNDGENQEMPDFQEQGAGSGFVWDKDGHIITNNHVVEGADIIRIQFSDGSIALGELIGADPASDLAVVLVNISPDKLNPIQTADSTQVKIGQIAVAIGNPFQLDGSMTTGIISGIGRSLPLASDQSGTAFTIPDIIQTDAPINPGNSGGVLVDISGQLIGITTAIESPVRANAGIGYAVPSVIIEKIVPFLIKDGVYQQPWIGISGTTLTPELAEAMDVSPSITGALVREVVPGSPANKAGLIGSSKEVTIYGSEALVGGDIITAIDSSPISDFEDLVAFLARYTNVGTEITLSILRDGESIELDLTLGARPAEESQATELPREIPGGVWLGITGVDLASPIAEAMELDGDTQGVLVQQVATDSPADNAGLKGSYKPFDLEGQSILIGGDIITDINGEQIASMRALISIIMGFEPGDTITLAIIRDGEKTEVDVTLEERPS